MVRVESVPMRSDCLSEELIDTLIEKGLEVGMDQLSLWDIGLSRIRRITVGRFAAELGVRPDEKAALSENMVFWILRFTGAKKPERVFHATQPARQIAKDLYYQVAHREGGKS
jgi:hypothetical protein